MSEQEKPERSSVGKSSRTPFKHWILNREIGRQMGIFASPVAARRVPARPVPFHIIDLCAGDGMPPAGERSSPEIICHHARWGMQRGVRVEATFIERADFTFDSLRRNVADEDWIDLIHGDAREFVFQPTSPRQAIFIHSDPNSIADWPLTPELLDGMTPTTTLLATLGCNVGGLKRLSQDKRLAWYEHVSSVVRGLPHFHDAILVSLTGDASQWAYLIRTAAKWSPSVMAAIRKEGGKFWDRGVCIASYRLEPAAFHAIEDELFLTRKELAQ